MKKSLELFWRSGIKGITMDDISRELGISKKTLYQYVENKSGLIGQLFQQHVDQEKDCLCRIQLQSADAIHELLKVSHHIIEKLRAMSPTAVFDMKKYYPEIWKQVESMKHKLVYSAMRANLERGIREGVYRPGINPDIVAKFCVVRSSLMADEGLFPANEYGLGQLYREYIDYHIRGIASPKGIQALEKYLAAEKLVTE
ncbi:MAG: TetR/AcrR family transcriptional regulator [Phaeodactylibacter sp.]|nr:TetR/AcrR family transcriptional regulator [Phaeodactylibacter sp.]MCB9275400.1 TetR/AcrR family transcriptional regulator [Lewinellaceae bacterium]